MFTQVDDARRTARYLARRVMLVVTLGALAVVAMMLAVRALRLGHPSVEVTPTVLLGLLVMVAGVFLFVESVTYLPPLVAVGVGIVMVTAGIVVGTFVMMRPSDGVGLTPWAMLALAAACFAVMALLTRHVARWLDDHNDGRASAAIRELVGAFALVAVIMAAVVAIDPHGQYLTN